jgi:predicted Rossmann-fold nucleotide-binding protein
MHERKAMMAERAVLLLRCRRFRNIEEILEIATWGQLNQHQKPMILYNVNGFYNALNCSIRPCSSRRFPLQHRAKLIVCDEIDQIYNVIKNLKNAKKICCLVVLYFKKSGSAAFFFYLFIHSLESPVI